MKIFLTTLTSFLFLSCVALAKKPNFVYIMVDDAGYGDFSCFGQKKFKTTKGDWKNARVWWVPMFNAEVQVPSIELDSEVPF